jgi:hypothetical protein
MIMRTAFVALAGLLVSASLTACSITTNPDGSITLKPPTEYVSDQKPVRELAFTGQSIEVLNDSPNPGFNLEFSVVGSATATKVTAAATISASGDAGDVENAQTAHKEVIESFTVTESGGRIVVKCGHSTKKYGSISVAGTGCKSLVVTVPAGDAAKPISLVVKSGNSDIRVSGVTGSVAVEAGGTGAADVSVTPAKDSIVSVLSDDESILRLPATFSADLVTVTAADAKDVDTTAFPNLKSGEGFGTAGTGAKSISVKSTGLIGKAMIVRQ